MTLINLLLLITTQIPSCLCLKATNVSVKVHLEPPGARAWTHSGVRGGGRGGGTSHLTLQKQGNNASVHLSHPSPGGCVGEQAAARLPPVFARCASTAAVDWLRPTAAFLQLIPVWNDFQTPWRPLESAQASAVCRRSRSQQRAAASVCQSVCSASVTHQ